MSAARRRERLLLLGLLVLLCAAFVAFNVPFIRRLTNAHFGDVEFTGWSGPIAARVAAGERPYVDFVLPIPPGSFVVLAAVQKLVGTPLLLQELWTNAIVQLLMALVAFAIAARFTTKPNALLVALTSLIALTWLNKECAYDHTAQLVVWTSFGTGAWALLERRGPRRRRLWIATGLLAAFTIAFKQSTGSGALVGWAAALAYLVLVERVSGEREARQARLGDARAWLLGVLVGIGLVVLLLRALGSNFGDYWQSVFVDGPALKGGSERLVRNVLGYVTIRDAWLSSLAVTLAIAAVFARIALRHRTLHVGDELGRLEPLEGRTAALIGLAIVVPFCVAIVLLGTSYHGFRPSWVYWIDRLKIIPHFGFVFGTAFCIAHLRRTSAAEPGPPARALRAGHALNALVIAALITSLLHNTSAPEFRAFYDNNPIIPLAFLMLFIAMDRAGLPAVKAGLVVLTLVSLFGNRFDRAMAARTPIGKEGYWAGMRVSERGLVMARVALRVRQLAAQSETVLVLPEDIQLGALIGRPRPALKGAIVFVDQYPKRLVAADVAELTRHPPKVIVVHPAESHLWTQLFRVWSGDSGAQKLVDFVLADLLPRRYVRDARYKNRWLYRDSTLEIWVRRDGP